MGASVQYRGAGYSRRPTSSDNFSVSYILPQSHVAVRRRKHDGLSTANALVQVESRRKVTRENNEVKEGMSVGAVSPTPAQRQDYVTEAGERISLRLDSPFGASANILRVRYASATIGGQEPRFTVQSGIAVLVISVEASRVGAPLELIAIGEDNTEHLLETFSYNPSDAARSYAILGID